MTFIGISSENLECRITVLTDFETKYLKKI